MAVGARWLGWMTSVRLRECSLRWHPVSLKLTLEQVRPETDKLVMGLRSELSPQVGEGRIGHDRPPGAVADAAWPLTPPVHEGCPQ